MSVKDAMGHQRGTAVKSPAIQAPAGMSAKNVHGSYDEEIAEGESQRSTKGQARMVRHRIGKHLRP